MQRARLSIDGDVQGVGYREIVKKIAKKLRLVGSVKNLEDGRVEVICEGEEEAINEFIKQININEHPINVENITTTFEEPIGEKKFMIRRGSPENEMREAFETWALYLRLMRENLKGRTEYLELHTQKNFDKMENEHKEICKNMEKLIAVIEKLTDRIQKDNEKLADIVEKAFDIFNRMKRDVEEDDDTHYF